MNGRDRCSHAQKVPERWPRGNHQRAVLRVNLVQPAYIFRISAGVHDHVAALAARPRFRRLDRHDQHHHGHDQQWRRQAHERRLQHSRCRRSECTVHRQRAGERLRTDLGSAGRRWRVQRERGLGDGQRGGHLQRPKSALELRRQRLRQRAPSAVRQSDRHVQSALGAGRRMQPRRDCVQHALSATRERGGQPTTRIARVGQNWEAASAFVRSPGSMCSATSATFPSSPMRKSSGASPTQTAWP
jgi:hypothetical protein